MGAKPPVTVDPNAVAASTPRDPESVAEQLASGSWRFLEEVPVEPVGQIPIENVRFDSTKRKELDGSILDEFIR